MACLDLACFRNCGQNCPESDVYEASSPSLLCLPSSEQRPCRGRTAPISCLLSSERWLCRRGSAFSPRISHSEASQHMWPCLALFWSHEIAFLRLFNVPENLMFILTDTDWLRPSWPDTGWLIQHRGGREGGECSPILPAMAPGCDLSNLERLHNYSSMLAVRSRNMHLQESRGELMKCYREIDAKYQPGTEREALFSSRLLSWNSLISHDSPSHLMVTLQINLHSPNQATDLPQQDRK